MLEGGSFACPLGPPAPGVVLIQTSLSLALTSLAITLIEGNAGNTPREYQPIPC